MNHTVGRMPSVCILFGITNIIFIIECCESYGITMGEFKGDLQVQTLWHETAPVIKEYKLLRKARPKSMEPSNPS